MKDMIGYCGLDCEKCDAYIATINDNPVSYTHLDVYKRQDSGCRRKAARG